VHLSRRAKMLTVLAALVAVLAIGGRWVWRQVSFSPFALCKPVSLYLLGKPGLLEYCFVPIGTTEAAIRRRFGEPECVLSVHTSDYQEHIEMRRRRAGWTLPTRALTDRVVLYIDAAGLDQLEAYYFIDDNGRLAATFISEE